jgi:hypothetical protein
LIRLTHLRDPEKQALFVAKSAVTQLDGSSSLHFQPHEQPLGTDNFSLVAAAL